MRLPKSGFGPVLEDVYDYDQRFEGEVLKVIKRYLRGDYEATLHGVESSHDFNCLSKTLKFATLRPGKDGPSFVSVFDRFDKTKIDGILSSLGALHGPDALPAVVTTVDRARVAIVETGHNYRTYIEDNTSWFSVIRDRYLAVNLRGFAHIIAKVERELCVPRELL